MDRRSLLQSLAALAALPWLGSSLRAAERATKSGAIAPLAKTHAQWHALLPEPAYRVLFEGNTERAFSSPLNAEKRAGSFLCAACLLPLFDSTRKFESGTGWPSFTQPIAGRVGTRRDYKTLFLRTEYHCIRCGGHQGHVFDDGPPPRGERWCNNGLALRFVAKDQPLPALRT